MGKMIIHAISDLHGEQPDLPGGDLLIIAGDCTSNDSEKAWKHFATWIYEQPYQMFVIVPGNHDGLLEDATARNEFSGNLCVMNKILVDEPFEWHGIKMYGMPWTPTFCNWHFMAGPQKRAEKAQAIPPGLDILITHGPPIAILDAARGQLCGCTHLRDAIDVTKPKVHVFGHIHGHGGKQIKRGATTFCNVAALDDEYQLVRGPTVIFERYLKDG